jgi:leucyl aminopeptidase
VLGVFEPGRLAKAPLSLARSAVAALDRIIRRGDMVGKLGSTLLLHDVAGIPSERVLLVGLGNEADLTEQAFRRTLAAAFRVLGETGAANATLALAHLKAGKRDIEWAVRQAVSAALDINYRFDAMKSGKPQKPPALSEVRFLLGDQAGSQTVHAAITVGAAIGSGVALAKTLGNLPPNVCTPSYLAEQAQALARKHKLKITVLDRSDMEVHKMGAFLAVTQGSAQPPKMIILEYRGGAKKDPPVVLIGKGITFDTGGISIKPSAEMDEMKYDMSGAGSVLGTLKACAEMELKQNVVGILAACENMPSGSASRPGDVVTSMSGQTVEILNTDAEGRLVLCDAMTYAERFAPSAVIDIATLTGACIIALGHVAAGMYSNKSWLAEALLRSADDALDRVWQMPLWDDYQEQLNSNFADMANIGGRPAGSVTAACFLSRFARKYPWAHLDIAGVAWKSGRDKGSTGRPVPLLCSFLLDRDATRAKA